MRLYELSQRFYFEAAHTLKRAVDAPDELQRSQRIHGHTYRAEVTVRGPRDATTGMVVDLDILRREISSLRETLDHSFLDDVPGLSTPTMEGLCDLIAERLKAMNPPVISVRVWREASGDACVLKLGESSSQ